MRDADVFQEIADEQPRCITFCIRQALIRDAPSSAEALRRASVGQFATTRMRPAAAAMQPRRKRIAIPLCDHD